MIEKKTGNLFIEFVCIYLTSFSLEADYFLLIFLHFFNFTILP